MAFEQQPLKKVQILAPAWYARKDVQNAMFEFCKNRETVPRYLEGFGKRPDALDYPSDIIALVRKGATSFHCSEEIWANPMDINTDMSADDYNQIKIGWDFLIDIDSPYLDYSKIAANLIVKALEYHGVNNVGIKFSGSKGFHILIPFKSFPKELFGEQTKDKFPEWPRYIAAYITSMIHDELTERILDLTSEGEVEKKKDKIFKIIYKPTGEEAEVKKIGKYICPNFKCKSEVNSMKSNRKEMICPSCNGKMQRVSQEEVWVATSNQDNSKKHPQLFERKATAEGLIDSVDIVLVSSRHLFRAPYSLHEKTSLVSAVITKEELENFKPTDADPLRVKIRNYMPDSKPDEARDLLIQAIDFAKKSDIAPVKKYDGESIDLSGLTISEDMFPPIILKLLDGIKDDGRKRALNILLSFFSSLQLPQDYIEEKVGEWNKKNYHPLKEGYIKSQISWFVKNPRMPPNYDKPIYKEFGMKVPPTDEKNPLNYTIKLALKAKGKSERKTHSFKEEKKHSPEI